MRRRRHPLLLAFVICLQVLASGCVLRALQRGGIHGHGPEPLWPCTAGRCGTIVPERKEQDPVYRPPQRHRPTGLVRANVGFAGGRLQVVGSPHAHPTRVLVAVRSVADLDSAPCNVRVVRDAATLTLHDMMRTSEHELRAVIELEALRDLDQSWSFAGEVCGQRFQIDAYGRATLAQFEARFRERLATARPVSPIPAEPVRATNVTELSPTTRRAVTPAR